MKRYFLIARALLLIAPLVAVVPLGTLLLDWLDMQAFVPDAPSSSATPGFDWVVWSDEEGVITASYVFPGGPGDLAGIEAGDLFFTLDGAQFFTAQDLKRSIEGIPPGSQRAYSLTRAGQPLDVQVRIGPYPTFLYPLSPSLWQFSLWSFTVGGFLHLLGLILAAPLALRSRRARFSLLLIAASSLWIFGTLFRLLLIQVLGPIMPGSSFAPLFEALTLLGLMGWILFPVLLVHKIVHDTSLPRGPQMAWIIGLVYAPPLLLCGLAVFTTVAGPLGPFTLARLIGPVLFYVSWYVAIASVLVLGLYRFRSDEAAHLVGGWGRTGSGLTLLIALFAVLTVPGVVPLLEAVTDQTVGWLIVSAQLLSIGPISLVSLSTLRYGKVNQVISRGVVYALVSGLLFILVVGGLSLIDFYRDRLETSLYVVGGAFATVVLLLFERVLRRLRTTSQEFFGTEGPRTRRVLRQFQEQMRTIIDPETLIQRTMEVVGQAFDVRSGVLYVQIEDEPVRWVSSRYQPESPYLTERIVRQVWPYIQQDGRIWSRIAEVNDSRLPPAPAALLTAHGAALAVPIMGEGSPMGLLILGPKRTRFGVYNLTDLDMLRALSSQLALAIERLVLVEREKALVRQTAEANLVALRAQINPHFLFNALNTLLAFIHEQPEEAEEVVEDLAAIFRHTLHTGDRTFVTLHEELNLVRHYLHIEEARFGDRLTVQLDMPPSLRTHPVPAFSVQTLVENSIKHGLEPAPGPGTLHLQATREPDGSVCVRIHDTGVGIPALFDRPDGHVGLAPFFGIGLRNVASRLEHLFGEPDLLHLHSAPDSGTTASLRLPPRAPSGDGPPHRPDSAHPRVPTPRPGDVPSSLGSP
ncbi:MAG: histidine kinase [Bacteroidota bacterium]